MSAKSARWYLTHMGEKPTQQEKLLRIRLWESTEVLERVGCQFFACDGPNKRPVSMKTCRVCWQIRDNRRALGR